jgi:hypothetical protein
VLMRSSDDREPHFRLLHAELKNGQRVLENVSIHVAGEQTHHATESGLQTRTSPHGVFRYTVSKPLEPIEYDYVEMANEGINCKRPTLAVLTRSRVCYAAVVYAMSNSGAKFQGRSCSMRLIGWSAMRDNTLRR